MLVSACSTTQLAQLQNFKLFFSSKENVELSNEQISASPLDLAYVKRGEQPVITLALAFIENETYKWVSNDKAMIETLNGRITRLSGTEQILIHVKHLNEDPLLDILAGGSSVSNYKRRIDTQSDGLQNYGASVSSTFSMHDGESVSINGVNYPAIKIVETIQYQDIFHGKHTWNNDFYYHRDSQQLLQSTQTIAPNMETINIQYISRALRLKSEQKAELVK